MPGLNECLSATTTALPYQFPLALYYRSKYQKTETCIFSSLITVCYSPVHAARNSLITCTLGLDSSFSWPYLPHDDEQQLAVTCSQVSMMLQLISDHIQCIPAFLLLGDAFLNICQNLKLVHFKHLATWQEKFHLRFFYAQKDKHWQKKILRVLTINVQMVKDEWWAHLDDE